LSRKKRDTVYMGPLKAWNFIVSCIFQDWKVLEKATGPGKLWKSVNSSIQLGGSPGGYSLIWAI